MLRNYIERRERLLYGRDNNRRSLPFEWGLEHLGVQANGNFETVPCWISTRPMSIKRAFVLRAAATLCSE